MVTNIALFHSYLYTDALNTFFFNSNLIFCSYSQSSFTWLSFDDFDVVVLILFFLLRGGGFFTG